VAERVEKRKYPRVAAGVTVRYARREATKAASVYLATVAANVSLGGMFLACARPFKPGTVIDLEFSTGNGEEPSHVVATAVVRWRQRLTHPRGMGVEFVEFEGLGRTLIEEWLVKLLTSEASSTSVR
jgi:c-di-GMP-binding flagellar brake protein YcgR